MKTLAVIQYKYSYHYFACTGVVMPSKSEQHIIFIYERKIQKLFCATQKNSSPLTRKYSLYEFYQGSVYNMSYYILPFQISLDMPILK